MITRRLLLCSSFILASCCYLNAQNLITNNYSFEQNSYTPDKPDYWYPRFTQYHHVETNPAYVYAGSKCALFNNTSINANMNAFAITALAANYEITSNQDYLDKALYFMDIMCAFQLNSGMWSDDHNQYIEYHGIITRSLVKLLDPSPSSQAGSIGQYVLVLS